MILAVRSLAADRTDLCVSPNNPHNAITAETGRPAHDTTPGIEGVSVRVARLRRFALGTPSGATPVAPALAGVGCACCGATAGRRLRGAADVYRWIDGLGLTQAL
ncbi:hypothetical protein [Actinoplanes rectilineatus]|uniref:hypothetical protein n=1 Tax=Actinoplanes rectilineatus TaxID=113571 RepID=UPI000ABCBC2A|nr:hypothetical protein [Actinoplanes rectilineatus]